MNPQMETLIRGIKALSPHEIRAEEETFFECVIGRRKLEEGLAEALQAYFGPPLKPLGKDAGPEAKKKAEAHGGVRKDQIMYWKEYPEGYNACLIWPWSDGATLTVKIFRS